MYAYEMNQRKTKKNESETVDSVCFRHEKIIKLNLRQLCKFLLIKKVI